MGWDLGQAVNGFADWLCRIPLVRGVVSNPIYTALLVTALAVTVILATYHRQVRGAGYRKGTRAFVYVFLLVLAVLAAHHYVVVRAARQSATTKGVRDVFDSIEMNRTAAGGVLGGAGGARDPAGGVAGGGDCGCGTPAGGGPARPDNVAWDPAPRSGPRLTALPGSTPLDFDLDGDVLEQAAVRTRRA